MPRPMSAAMAAHLATGTTRLVKMLRLALRDETIICLTDHDEDLSYNLGSDEDFVTGAETYLAGSGILSSDIAQEAGTGAGSFEVTGPIDDIVSLPALLGGRFNKAKAWLFEIAWSDPRSAAAGGMGHVAWLHGTVATARPTGSSFVLEIRDDFDRFAQQVGESIVNGCTADHGDAHCKRTVESAVATVTAVTDALSFTVSTDDPWADGYFDKGKCEALTGANAGCEPIEVEKWGPGGVVMLYAFLAAAPSIGDTFTLKRGCPRTRAACMERANILNYRGEPDVPGSDQVMVPAQPGQGNG